MARRHVMHVVVTFPSTHDAVAMEDAAHAEGLPGRIVPVPVSITADCGIAWSTEPEDLPDLARVISARGLAYSKIYDLRDGSPREMSLGGE